jgi:hypothetical protein
VIADYRVLRELRPRKRFMQKAPPMAELSGISGDNY